MNAILIELMHKVKTMQSIEFVIKLFINKIYSLLMFNVQTFLNPKSAILILLLRIFHHSFRETLYCEK